MEQEFEFDSKRVVSLERLESMLFCAQRRTPTAIHPMGDKASEPDLTSAVEVEDLPLDPALEEEVVASDQEVVAEEVALKTAPEMAAAEEFHNRVMEAEEEYQIRALEAVVGGGELK